MPAPGLPHPYAVRVLPPRPERTFTLATRIMALVAVAAMLGGLMLPLISARGGSDSRSLAQLGRPDLAPTTGSSGVGAIGAWFFIIIFCWVLAEIVLLCLGMANLPPRWTGLLFGILGCILLMLELLLLLFVLLAAWTPSQAGQPDVNAGPGPTLLVLGQLVFLVMMFGPPFVRAWGRAPKGQDTDAKASATV